MKIAERLYAYPWRGNDNNCNSYVFAGVLDQGKHVVIDPGHLMTPYYREPALTRLFDGMAADGLVSNAVGLVILTHGHPDHCEGALAFREEQKALVALHQEDELSFVQFGGKVDLHLHEGALQLGSVSVQVFHTPGHTPGHIALYWPEEKTLVTGDTVFYRSTGRTDFPGGDAHKLKESVDRLSNLDVERLLCGHAYGNSGIINGREEVRENFAGIRRFFQ